MLVFDKLEVRSTKFEPKLTNLSPYVESTESSSEPKYDINTTQNTYTRRSKKSYELRAKMFKYTPKSVQLLEGRDDFPLPIYLQSKYKTFYNHDLYGAWLCSMPVLDVGAKISFFGNSYMISKSKINVANLGSFKQSVSLMPFFGRLYSRSNYLNIAK